MGNDNRMLTSEQQELIIQHLDFADRMAKTAKRYVGARVEADLLLAAAQGGLCEAALRFDDGVKVKFETYAYHWIKKALHRCVRECYSLGFTGGDEGDGFTIDMTNEASIGRIDRPDDYEDNLQHEQLLETVRAQMRQLPAAERRVLALSVGLEAAPLPATKVAQELHVNAATARAACCNALAHLAALTEAAVENE